MAEGRAKEIAMAERTKLIAAHEEARKEGAVQKALADGWSRDLRVRQEKNLFSGRGTPQANESCFISS